MGCFQAPGTKRWVAALAVASTVWAGTAFAEGAVLTDTTQTANPSIQQIQNGTGSYAGEGIGSMLLKTIFALFVVVVLVYIGVYLLKRFMVRPKMGSHGMPVRILGSTLLGPKKVVTLVEVEGRILVLGVTDSTITCLTEFKKTSVPGAGPAAPDAVKSSGMNFGEMFHKLIKRRGSDG